jgi:hypothetical protein
VSKSYLKSDRAVLWNSIVETVGDDGPGGEDQKSLSSHGLGESVSSRWREQPGGPG